MNLTSQQRLIAALSIAFTCLYLYFETRYNRALLDLFSIPDPTKSVIDNLSREGKFLAARVQKLMRLRNTHNFLVRTYHREIRPLYSSYPY